MLLRCAAWWDLETESFVFTWASLLNARMQGDRCQRGDSDKVSVSEYGKGGLREIKCKSFCIALDRWENEEFDLSIIIDIKNCRAAKGHPAKQSCSLYFRCLCFSTVSFKTFSVIASGSFFAARCRLLLSSRTKTEIKNNRQERALQQVLAVAFLLCFPDGSVVRIRKCHFVPEHCSGWPRDRSWPMQGSTVQEIHGIRCPALHGQLAQQNGCVSQLVVSRGFIWRLLTAAWY